MMTVDLERALRSAGLAAPVRWDEVTGSTNATAADLAREGAPEWTLVGAAHQTEGRGRQGRRWEDDPGGALMVSIVLRPVLEPHAAGLLSLLAGAAWAEAISDVAAMQIRCKWPNDLLSGSAKAGGILAQSSLEGERLAWVILGSGINLVAPDEVEGAVGVGPDVDPTALLAAFLSRFAQSYPPGDGFADEVVRRWSAVSATLGERVVALDIDGGGLEGTAVAIDRRGGLVVELASGERRTVTSEEIVHLR